MGSIRPGNLVKQVFRQSAHLWFSLRDREFRVQTSTRDAIYCREVDRNQPQVSFSLSGEEKSREAARPTIGRFRLVSANKVEIGGGQNGVEYAPNASSQGLKLDLIVVKQPDF